MAGDAARSETLEAGPSLDHHLRKRVREEVVPALAAAILDARGIDTADSENPTRTVLDESYRLALVIVFRTLVVALAEARGHPPLDDSDSGPRPLHALIREASSRDEFTSDSTALFERLDARSTAIDDSLFEIGGSPLDTELTSVELPDAAVGPALAALLLDDAGDPLAFDERDVRTLGEIYEGLVGSELAIEGGEVALRGRSGEREATGTYYTRPRFVAHLLDRALEPALDAHCDRLDGLDANEAGDAFFDLRIADVAMGAGGFLVAALDRVAGRLTTYLDERPLPGVEAELDRLRAAAGSTAASNGEARGRSFDADRETLLRRLVARRCVFGVDSDPLAVALARSSLWLESFVPGPAPTRVRRHLVAGDSLTGIGSFAEAEDVLDSHRSTDAVDAVDDLRESVAELNRTHETDGERDHLRATFDVLAAARIDDDVDPNPIVGGDRATRAIEAARVALEPTDSVQFPVAFPGVFGRANPGFDVVVGNPPWEESILDEDAFWTRYAPGLQREESHGGTKEEAIGRLRETRPDLESRYEREKAARETRRKLLRSGPYPGMGTGDPDAYKAFCWRNWALLREGGHLGLVLPRGAFVGAGSADFRRELLENGIVADCTFLKNRDRWVFEGVGPRFTVGLLAARKATPSEEATLPIRGPFTDLASFEAGIGTDPHRFLVAEATEWTGTTLFPMLPADPRSVGVFETMARNPRLDRDEPEKSDEREESEEWRARPYRELDETTDRTADDGTTLIHTTDEPPDEGFWPVLDGASLNPPNEPGWVMDTGARFGWADPEVLLPYLQEARENSYRYAGVRSAFAEFSESWVRDSATLPCLGPRVAFRHVTQRTNRRTVCASLVPPEVFLTNAAPYLLWPRGDERDQAYLLGVLNAIPFDWYARLFVEANVNYHILNSLRVPRPGRESDLRRRVEEVAGRLAARDERYVDWADAVGVEWGPLGEREEMERVRELDAAVAHLFGLSREDVRVVFETFHRTWDHEERLAGVLERFEALDG